MTGELVVLVRIGLYFLAGWLASNGLPASIVEMITQDPSVADALSQAIAAALAGLVYLWSRIAKRFGWAT